MGYIWFNQQLNVLEVHSTITCSTNNLWISKGTEQSRNNNAWDDDLIEYLFLSVYISNTQSRVFWYCVQHKGLKTFGTPSVWEVMSNGHFKRMQHQFLWFTYKMSIPHHYRSWMIQDLITAFHNHVDILIDLTWIACLIESMIAFMNEYLSNEFVLSISYNFLPMSISPMLVACCLAKIIFTIKVVFKNAFYNWSCKESCVQWRVYDDLEFGPKAPLIRGWSDLSHELLSTRRKECHRLIIYNAMTDSVKIGMEQSFTM